MKWALGCMVLVSGCGEVKGDQPDAPRPIDSPGLDVAAPDSSQARCDPSKPFGTPLALTELNTAQQDYTPSLSPDELTIYFGSTRAGGSGLSDMYIATRSSPTAAFGAPSLLAGVNSIGYEQRPTITGDGLVMYTEVNPGATGADWSIALSTRASTAAGFSVPLPFGVLNTASNEVAPFVLPDHSAIYFVSNRTNASGEFFRAERAGNSFMAPLPVTGTNLQDANSKDYPALTPDELVLYFASNRPGGIGGTDIWVATRPSEVTGFGAPVNVTELNSGGSDAPGWVSADNCVMYFSRAVGSAAALYDLYVARRPL